MPCAIQLLHPRSHPSASATRCATLSFRSPKDAVSPAIVYRRCLCLHRVRLGSSSVARAGRAAHWPRHHETAPEYYCLSSLPVHLHHVFKPAWVHTLAALSRLSIHLPLSDLPTRPGRSLPVSVLERERRARPFGHLHVPNPNSMLPMPRPIHQSHACPSPPWPPPRRAIVWPIFQSCLP